MKFIKENNGRFTHTKPAYAKAIVFFTVIGIVGGIGLGAIETQTAEISGWNGIESTSENGTHIDKSDEAIGTCKRIGEGSYDCTDDATREKVYEAAKSGIKWYVQEERLKTIIGSVSKYSRQDSCHNPKGTECLTASGEDTKEGRTIACPRSIKLGTRIQINGEVYTCLDRTAKWVEAKFGPTYDIFTESHDAALKFGRKTLEVAILN